MKHLPNLLTLSNLFCGCMAIVFILNAQPYMIDGSGESYYYINGTEQAYWGAIFIGIAAICDVLDGLIARSLNMFSPIGKDLDSLADLVSFGVAPSMILYKMLWASYMREPGALDAPIVVMAPAFLVAVFAALRLARYNVTVANQQITFTGMPVPAVGLFVASFPLINWFNPYGMGTLLQGKWTIYCIIILLCWFMISRIRFIKMIPAQWNMATAWPQLILLAVGAAAVPVLKVAAIPLIFVLYIVLSLAYKPKQNISAA